MSDKPVYLEAWVPIDDGHTIVIDDGMSRWNFTGMQIGEFHCDEQPIDCMRDCARGNLAAAAPALVRALLAVEWGGYDRDMSTGACPDCPALDSPEPNKKHDAGWRHGAGCLVDNALTAAGFPDQASRDEARKRIAEARV
jgi:hypothetical protein